MVTLLMPCPNDGENKTESHFCHISESAHSSSTQEFSPFLTIGIRAVLWPPGFCQNQLTALDSSIDSL